MQGSTRKDVSTREKTTSNRRNVIQAIGGSSILGTAGCLGISGNRDGNSGEDIIWTSSSEGTVTFGMTQGLMSVLDEYSDLNVTHRSSAGTEQNMGRLNQNEATIAHSDSWVSVNAQLGEMGYEGVNVKPNQLFSWFEVYFPFLTNNENLRTITDISTDYRGSPGPEGDSYRTQMDYILSMFDIDYSEASIPYAEQGSTMKSGEIDFAVGSFMNGVVEAGWHQDMKSIVDNLSIIGYTDEQVSAINDDPRLNIGPVDMTQYDGYNYVPEPKDSLEMYVVPIFETTRADADYDTIYEIVKTLYENREELPQYHGLFDFFTEGEYWTKVLVDEVPVHPAAADLYQEKGVWDDRLSIGDED